jgi:starch synthase (maltosyl-transferring)
MRPPEKMFIYNLFPLLAGPFSGWETHFRRAKEMRFNWIFVNPIQRPGASGSIYSIADYFSVNPALTEPQSGVEPEAQLRAAMDSAKKLGLGMMIDLVINHCAIDSSLIREHPEWFLRERGGGVAHPFARHNGKKVVWKDLARFDHPGTRDKGGLSRFFLGVIEHLVDLGFKGFRCDAAYQIPADLWRRLIGETKARHPEVVFLAETLGCPPEQTRKTAGAGFDYVFNSSRWWDFPGQGIVLATRSAGIPEN